jgi:hypothetical protein
VAPDGRSFVFLRSLVDAPVTFVHDWKYELRARMNAAGTR